MGRVLRIGGAFLFAYFLGEWVGAWLGRTFPSMAGWSYWPGVALAGYVGFHVGEAADPASWREDAPPDRITPKKVLSLVGAVASAWFFAPFVGGMLQTLFPRLTIDPKWPGIIGALVLGYAAGGLIGETIQRRSVTGFSKGGGWDLILRPVKGAVAEFVVAGTLIVAYAFALGYFGVTSFAKHIDEHVFGINPVMPGPAFAALLVPLLLLFENHFPALLRFIARALRWPRRMLRVAGFGKGGSGTFGGLLDEWECLYKRGDILLGASSYNKNHKIGLKDDRHLLTIAATGGGKGRSAIIPNLLLWPHSAIVIDPKGTNAAVTALNRGKGGGRVKNFMGQDVHIVDPFGVLRAQGIDIETSSFNPLADLDMDSPTIFEDIAALADALIVPNPKTDPHWDNKARSLIAGAIAHVISTYPREHRTLIAVRDMLLGASPDEFKITLQNMMLNPMAAGLARETALDILRAEGSEEMRNVYSNVQKIFASLLSPAMRRTLSRSHFSLSDLQKKRMTLYLVLPPEELATHARFLRLFVAAGLRTMMKHEPGKRRKHPVLFVLDEFLALGRMDSVLSATNVARSYGIKLWPITQNVNGLAELYGQNWHTFVDAAGAVQVFSIAGKPSAEFLAERLGHQVIARATPGGVQVMPVALRSGPELQEDVDRDWNKQIVLRAGKKPLFLNRTPYDKRRYFTKPFYSPDPDHPGS